MTFSASAAASELVGSSRMTSLGFAEQDSGDFEKLAFGWAQARDQTCQAAGRAQGGAMAAAASASMLAYWMTPPCRGQRPRNRFSASAHARYQAEFLVDDTHAFLECVLRPAWNPSCRKLNSLSMATVPLVRRSRRRSAAGSSWTCLRRSFPARARTSPAATSRMLRRRARARPDIGACSHRYRGDRSCVACSAVRDCLLS
jgi:hypothetical protein